MTLKEFRKLKHRDFSNGAVLDEIEKVIEERDVLANRLIECEEVTRDEDGTLRWTGSGEPVRQ